MIPTRIPWICLFCACWEIHIPISSFGLNRKCWRKSITLIYMIVNYFMYSMLWSYESTHTKEISVGLSWTSNLLRKNVLYFSVFNLQYRFIVISQWLHNPIILTSRGKKGAMIANVEVMITITQKINALFRLIRRCKASDCISFSCSLLVWLLVPFDFSKSLNVSSSCRWPFSIIANQLYIVQIIQSTYNRRLQFFFD